MYAINVEKSYLMDIQYFVGVLVCIFHSVKFCRKMILFPQKLNNISYNTAIWNFDFTLSFYHKSFIRHFVFLISYIILYVFAYHLPYRPDKTQIVYLPVWPV